MEASKNPAYLRAIAEAVVEFREAFASFMELHVVHEGVGRYTLPAVFAIDKAKPEEIAKRQAAVDRAAGKAAAATGLTGVVMAVVGGPTIDPIAAWFSITKPKPMLEPDEIYAACNTILGRLDALILKADAEAPPTIGTAAMHPLIWGAASALWRDRYFRQAVSGAAEALIGSVKNRSGRNDVAETDLWKQVLSNEDPTPGKPRLRWPGDPTDRNVKSMSDGLRQYAPGVQMTIRNMTIHSHDELSEQEALERLAALSLLAHWIERCELIEST